MIFKVGDKVKLVIHRNRYFEPYLNSKGEILKLEHARALVKWDNNSRLLKCSELANDNFESVVLKAQLEVINEEN